MLWLWNRIEVDQAFTIAGTIHSIRFITWKRSSTGANCKTKTILLHNNYTWNVASYGWYAWTINEPHLPYKTGLDVDMRWMGLSLGTPWSTVHKKDLLAKYYDYDFVFGGCYVTFCIEMCLECDCGYNIHVDCGENFVLHHCMHMLQGLLSQSIDNIVSCSQTLAGRRGSLWDSGYVWLFSAERLNQ